MYTCLQKQVTYVATLFSTTIYLGANTSANKSTNSGAW